MHCNMKDMTQETGWVVVRNLETVYDFKTFEAAFNFQLIFMGHLMTRWYFDHQWKPDQLKKN
tara:strand:+ start:4243 stop:4428 length:186 start_codon:yes stop_codon:yes gene_type:complete